MPRHLALTRALSPRLVECELTHLDRDPIDVARALAPLRPLAHIVAPGCVDGGDVLVVGKGIFIGRTGRTNDDGIAVDPSEPMGANVVRLDDGALLYGASYPRTRAVLEARGYRVTTVDASELAKAAGAVTCCSLVMRA